MAEKENVTRITATDDTPSKKSKKGTQSQSIATKDATKTKAKAKAKAAEPVKAGESESKTTKRQPKQRRRLPLGPFGRYLKGAWAELRLVRWPNRRATWSMTLAVLMFSVAFGVVILLLDILFQYLFDFMVK